MEKRRRIIRKGDCGVRTKELIARYYLTLMSEFMTGDRRTFLSMERGDIFHYAITLILQDSSFQSLESDENIMERIRRRIANVIREVTQDHNQEKRRYADDIQAEEEEGR